jgi:hypothetical protein
MKENGQKVAGTEIVVHPAESWGLSTYLWLHCRKQTLICWWSYYVVMKHYAFHWGYTIFFNYWLKYSKSKFFIKNGKTKEWAQSLLSFVGKFATSNIRGHNMFPFIISSCLKLGCEKPSPFKLMEFGIHCLFFKIV